MNLGGVARTDRILDEIGRRQPCAATDEDEMLAALAAWVGQIDDVPVAHRRGRHRGARSRRLHRLLGGGAVVLATFSGASVAAALSGAQVPGLTSFGRAVVELVPGEQLLAQDPHGGGVAEAVPADDVRTGATRTDGTPTGGTPSGEPADAAGPAQADAAQGPADGSTQSRGARADVVAHPEPPAVRIAATLAYALAAPERVPPDTAWTEDAPVDTGGSADLDEPGPAPVTPTPPVATPGQPGPPEHARKDVVPGQERTPPGQRRTTPPGQDAAGTVPAPEPGDPAPADAPPPVVETPAAAPDGGSGAAEEGH